MKIKTGYISFIFIAMLLYSCSKKDVPQGMVYIPAGEFIMGSEEVDSESLAEEAGARQKRYYENEKPQRKVSVKAFHLDMYEVTNKEYKVFVDVTSRVPPQTWEGRTYAEGRDDHPVNFVTWHDADTYCKWANKRLPMEEEWEKAARGPNGNIYPWGNEYDEEKANLSKGDTMSVGSYETDKSHYGVYDMGGNVMEWIDAWYEPYPGNKTENKDYGKKYRILRGGSGSVIGHWVMSKIFARPSFRHYYYPLGADVDAGFRCAKDAE